MPQTVAYVPLHTHSQFSLLEASSKIKDMIAVAKTNGFTAMALTDSGNIYGAVDFYSQCKANGIKPIIGCELYVMEGDPTEKGTKKPAHNIVLLCKNLAGYKNLVKLISQAHLEGFYYRPRINWEQLAAHREGLMVLTDCLHGPLGYHLLRGHRDKALDNLQWLKTHFGNDVYVELQDHGQGPELQVSQLAVSLAEELGVACVITNDDRFPYQGQETVLDILLCMQVGTTLNDPNRRKRYGADYYIKNGDELATRFGHLSPTVVKKALANTLLVAEKVDFHWPMGESILPQYPLPEGQTEATYLRELVLDYCKQKYADPIPEHVLERANYELEVINNMGFPAYFLIVWDFINYARTNGIPVGPGRGSAAGSLVAYVLGITNIDPIYHNLLFERFLNPERVSMPDVDIDFCIERRGEVIEYVAKRYGRERVCQIATFGTLAAKAAVKAVARVLDIPFEESNRISKMIPSMPGTKLKDALEDGMELANEVKANAHVKEWIELALQLEGTACNVGTHAAGVVISKDPLDEVIALQASKDGMVISQFTMGDLEKLGLLKMDFLGLRNLTIIHNALQHIERNHGVTLDMDHLPLDDMPVYELLTAGDTDGVFQLESSGMKQLVKELKPSFFEDINALVALYRPGPLNSGMVQTFVNRKHGREEVSFPHPSLEPILKDTYGTIVYQEQIMQIAQVLAGYSLGQADLLRRAMGKKKADVMEKEREGFLAGAIKNNVNQELANGLFDTMTEFAAYCFNRSHSAAYAFVAFQTAYLKAHYPVDYLAALLSSVSDSIEKIQHYIIAGRRMGIPVLPPCVKQSVVDFYPDAENRSIRFGMASIKGVGVGVVESILAARKEAPFESLEDFLKRVESKALNRKTLEALIEAGAFSSFGLARKHLMQNIDTLISFAQESAKREESGQASLFDLFASDSNNEGGGASGSALMLQGNSSEEYSDDEIQKREKALLGFYLTSHPLDSILEVLPLVTSHSISELTEVADSTEVRVGGLVASAGLRMSKKGKPLIIGSLEDVSGANDFLVFGNAVEQYKEVLVEGAKVILKAKVSFRGDSEENESFTLIVNEAKPATDCQPVELLFTTPPTYEELVYVGKILALHRGDTPVVLCFEPPEEEGIAPASEAVSRGRRVRFKTSPNFWVSPERLGVIRQQLASHLSVV